MPRPIHLGWEKLSPCLFVPRVQKVVFHPNYPQVRLYVAEHTVEVIEDLDAVSGLLELLDALARDPSPVGAEFVRYVRRAA